MSHPIQLTKTIPFTENSINRSPLRCRFLFIALASLALSPTARAVTPSAKASGHQSPSDFTYVVDDVCPTPWQRVANMPLDNYGAAGASDGTYSYHAGGYSFSTGTTLNTLYRYDPVANSWTTLAPMPGAVIMASAVYYPTTNKIYVFGGEDAVSGVNSNATRIYDIASNTWSAGAKMPDVRSFMASGYNSANGKIYLVSGYRTGTVDSAQPDTWEYDPVANTFTSKAMFPHPAGGMASGFINGLLYVAGGRDAANLIINLNWAFDPVANTWTAKANMPAGDTNVPGSAVALDNLWVFGGGNPFGPIGQGSTKAAFVTHSPVKGEIPDTSNIGLVYDPGTDSWSSAPNMNVVRSFPSSAAIGAKLIAAGGFDGATTVASAEVRDACIPGELTLVSAASVKGPFAIDLPLSGTPGIEDRTGGPRRLYEIVLTFDNIITSVDDVATSCGTVRRATVDSGDAHRLIVNLAGVTCTAEDVTITLTGVHDDQGGTLDTSLTFGLLVGDVTGNGIVNSADVRLTQDALGKETNSHNFRADVNEDGRITRADVTIVKKQLGSRLP